MTISTNIPAMTASQSLHKNHAMLTKSITRLSTGSKITCPADDAGGLAVANTLDSQASRIVAAGTNVSNAISFTQTQEGYLKEVFKALNRMSELSMLALDATKSDEDRNLYNEEFSQLGAFITDAAGKTFNGQDLFSTSQVKVTIDSEGNTFDMAGLDLTVAAYSDATAATVGDLTSAADALSKVKAAIAQLASDRATVGSHQTRLTYTADQLMVTKENLMAASSRIKDTDMADESTEFAKQNILAQSGTAMLAQANQMTQSVLRLLQ